nr:GntR family transcriptional regulator [uncultured Halomonas sp.]
MNREKKASGTPSSDSTQAEDIIYERIVDALIDKRLRPGERLNEAKLAAAYRMPRSRVRRALTRLTAERLICFEMHRGAFVSLPSVEEAYDIFEARLHVEGAVARVACERVDASGIRRLREHLDTEHVAFAGNSAGVNRISGDFHVLLAEVAGNIVLTDIIKPLVRRFCIIQSLYERRSGVLCLVEEHREIVDLIEARRAEAAAEAAMEHCRHIFHSLDLSSKRRSEADIYEAGFAEPLKDQS